jgi:hypothetical protein
MLKLHKFKPLSIVTLIALLATTTYVGIARAAAFDQLTWDASDYDESANADHTFTIDLPAGIDFDADVTNDDQITIDFDQTSAYTQSGTWQVADFTITDGTTTYIPHNIQQGVNPQTPDCTGAAAGDEVAVAVETDTLVFKFLACDTTSFTASQAGGTITITIEGTTTSGTGELINPSSAGSYVTEIDLDDEGSASAYSGSVAVPTVTAGANDVTVSAVVDPSISLTLSTNTCAIGNIDVSSEGSCAYDVETATNADGGLTVYVSSTNSGALLHTNAVDTIDACSGTDCDSDASAGVTVGSEEYGFYVSAVDTAHTASGSYDTDSQAVPSLTTSILTASGPHASTDGTSTVTHGAAVSGVTAAGTYSHVVTWTVVGNY